MTDLIVNIHYVGENTSVESQSIEINDINK